MNKVAGQGVQAVGEGSAFTDTSAVAPVKSAIRALEVLELIVAQQRGLAAQEIALALGIPTSSLSYLLNTLVESGYLVRSGRYYAPGARFARLQPGIERHNLADRVKPLLRSLRRQLDETASYFVRRDFVMETLATDVSNQTLRYAMEVGSMVPLHAVAAGKALLATLDEGELSDYLRQSERKKYTSRTITGAKQLRAEVAKIRNEGIALTREEYTPGIMGFGFAVVAADGKTLGAFGVAIPAVRLNPALEARTIEGLRSIGAALSKSQSERRRVRSPHFMAEGNDG